MALLAAGLLGVSLTRRRLPLRTTIKFFLRRCRETARFSPAARCGMDAGKDCLPPVSAVASAGKATAGFDPKRSYPVKGQLSPRPVGRQQQRPRRQ
jgi:hypothetical protein